LKLESPGTTTYKVLGSWSGGYLHGDSWKLNSGVVKIVEDDEYYYFHGFSGSVYKCHKRMYGMTAFTYGVHGTLQKRFDESDDMTMTTLPEDTNFMELKYE
jgi:hypothetical protein